MSSISYIQCSRFGSWFSVHRIVICLFVGSDLQSCLPCLIFCTRSFLFIFQLLYRIGHWNSFIQIGAHHIWFSQWISVLHSHCSSNSRIEVFLFLIVFTTFTAARGRGFTPEIPPGQTFEFSSGTTFPGVGGFVEGSRTKFGLTLR